jgi:hypothetical protein
VITMESPKRIRWDSFRERTSMPDLRVFIAGSVTMYSKVTARRWSRPAADYAFAAGMYHP